MLVNKSSILIFKTVTCLSNPFKIASTTLSIYIIGINGDKIFTYKITSVDLYIKWLNCGAKVKIKSDISVEKKAV